VRYTRWIIVLGVCIWIIGAILFVTNGNDHTTETVKGLNSYADM
jgi:hypothetical protein